MNLPLGATKAAVSNRDTRPPPGRSADAAGGIQCHDWAAMTKRNSCNCAGHASKVVFTNAMFASPAKRRMPLHHSARRPSFALVMVPMGASPQLPYDQPLTLGKPSLLKKIEPRYPALFAD